MESVVLNPPPSPSAVKVPDTNERLTKNAQAHPAYDLPVNGTTSSKLMVLAQI